MRRSVIGLAVAALSAVTFASTSSASTGPDRATQASADRGTHERIVEYWTPQRRAAAIPRVVGPGGEPAAKPSNPGGGKGGGGAFATNWAFYPRYDGAPDPVLGVWTATQLHTTEVWATTTNGFDDDAGFAVVTDGNSDTTLESELAAEGRQAPTVGFSLSTDGIDYFAFGYPAQKKYKGSTLTYCAGPVTERYDGNETLALACDMTGGSSGGPWIRDYDLDGRMLNSVNSYGYASLNGVMFGPIFDAGEKAAFDRADAASCIQRCSTVAA